MRISLFASARLITFIYGEWISLLRDIVCTKNFAPNQRIFYLYNWEFNVKDFILNLANNEKKVIAVGYSHRKSVSVHYLLPFSFLVKLKCMHGDPIGLYFKDFSAYHITDNCAVYCIQFLFLCAQAAWY